VKVKASSSGDVGKRGLFVQEQDQVGALAEVGRRGSRRRDSPSLSEELVGKARAIEGGGTGHDTAPRASNQPVVRNAVLTLSTPRISATLQLFAERTT